MLRLLLYKTRKGLVQITNLIKTAYTTDMEKAMQRNHGIGYAEYNRSLTKRLEVEKKRDKEYEVTKKILTQL